MVNLAQTIDDIKSLKIQGATNVAKEGLKALISVDDKDLDSAINQLLSARPTEPLLQNCLTLVKRNGKKAALDLLVKLDELEEAIINHGTTLIKDGATILTHCHSSTVVETLKVSKFKGLKFKVYLTETRPLMQGRKTADDLIKAGIDCVMITDSEAATLVSKEDNIKIDLVLLGADAITKTGIYNKVGSYGIALSAKNSQVPVYILAKLLKYSIKKVEIEERQGKEIWEERPQDLEVYNPAFDYVPNELISGLVTEFGILKPEKIEDEVKKNYPWVFASVANENFHSELNRSLKEKIIVAHGSLKTPQKILSAPFAFTPPYKHYLHIGEKPDKKNHLFADFFLRVEEGGDFFQTAGGVGAESSVGTWTEVTTQFAKTWEKLHARILEADEKSGFIKIAYPLELFEKGNIPQLLSSVAGNIYGLKEIKNLRLLDLELPEVYVKSFPGPAFGIEGIRKITGIYDRPLVGSIIKPKLGLDYKEHAKVALAVYEGGGDFVKDDENLTSQIFNPFEKRVEEIMSGLTNLPDWKNKIYAFNVTAETEIMLKRAKFIKEKSGNCAMIDILTAGFSSVQSLRNANLGLIIHGLRAMHAALTRDPKEGLSMLVLAKLCRLAGIDSLHTGTVVGKMEGGEKEVIEINKFLLSDWFGLKPSLPVASGGLYPNLIPDLIRILGKNMLFNFGGGIHGHPQGSKAGAVAVRQAVDAVLEGKSLEEYGKTHQELKEAVDHWKL